MMGRWVDSCLTVFVLGREGVILSSGQGLCTLQSVQLVLQSPCLQRQRERRGGSGILMDAGCGRALRREGA